MNCELKLHSKEFHQQILILPTNFGVLCCCFIVACCMRGKFFKKLKMSSRKCYVCSCKSSPRWFKVSEELHEDVYACFNIKETVVLGDESLTFYASCRCNLTRWRESRPTNGKYFKIANSRGKPFLNNAPIA